MVCGSTGTTTSSTPQGSRRCGLTRPCSGCLEEGWVREGAAEPLLRTPFVPGAGEGSTGLGYLDLYGQDRTWLRLLWERGGWGRAWVEGSGKGDEGDTACTLGSSALEFQPRILAHCPRVSYPHRSVSPAGVSSPCIICVGMLTGHACVSQGPRVGAVPSADWTPRPCRELDKPVASLGSG